MINYRAARMAELEADGCLDKSGETELRVLTEARDNEEQFRVWWESHAARPGSGITWVRGSREQRGPAPTAARTRAPVPRVRGSSTPTCRAVHLGDGGQSRDDSREPGYRHPT